MVKCKVIGVGNDGKLKLSNGTKTVEMTREQIDKNISDGKISIDRAKVKCLDKQRDKNKNITAYLMIDQNGNKKVFKSKELKDAILSYQLDCINLTLTSDNRLVDKTPVQEPVKQLVKAVEKVQDKVVDTPIIRKEETKLVLKDFPLDSYIFGRIIKFVQNNFTSSSGDYKYPDIMIVGKECDESYINITKRGTVIDITNEFIFGSAYDDENIRKEFPKTLFSLVKIKNEKAIIICKDTSINLIINKICNENWLSGSDLTVSDNSGENNYKMRSLILNGLDWSKVESTEKMFGGANIKYIRIMNSVAPKLTNMYGMFKEARIEGVDLSTFRVTNLDRATSMFYGCNLLDTSKVNLGGLNFSKTRFVGMMFFLNAPSNYLDNKGCADNLIDQCKTNGWKGYTDGRPDDFDTAFSEPIKHYDDELNNNSDTRKTKEIRRIIASAKPTVDLKSLDIIRKVMRD